MKTTKEPQRAWLYARVPGNYIETKNTLNVLMLQAQRDGAEVVGWGYDIHHGCFKDCLVVSPHFNTQGALPRRRKTLSRFNEMADTIR